MPSKEKPYVILVAELSYSEICQIKKLNSDFSNINAIETFIGSKKYKEIGSGKFHDDLLKKLEKNDFIDTVTKKKIPEETIRLLQIQKDLTIKQLIQFPNLYYAKSHFPLEISKTSPAKVLFSPINSATNELTGFSYSSSGLESC